MLALSEAIAVISLVYYCTHSLHKASNLTQFTSAEGIEKKKEEASFGGNGEDKLYRSVLGLLKMEDRAAIVGCLLGIVSELKWDIADL